MNGIWKDQAIEELNSILDYCFDQSGKRAWNKLLNEFEIKSKRLVSNPQMGFPEPLLKNRPEVFRALLINKYYKLIYYVNDTLDTLYIVDVWDSRMHPDQLVKRITKK